MLIRKAKLQDCESICRLSMTSELRDSLANIDLLSYFRKIVTKSNLFFVAEIKNQIVGFVLAEELLGKCAYVHLITVDNCFRNHGIGGRLMVYLKKKTREKKIDYLFLFAPKKQPNLIKFYKSQNFNKKGDYILFDVND